jgi:hypothetical protein
VTLSQEVKLQLGTKQAARNHLDSLTRCIQILKCQSLRVCLASDRCERQVAVNRLVNLRRFSVTFFRTEMVRTVFQVGDVYGSSFSCFLFLVPGIFMTTPISQTKKKRNFRLKLSDIQLAT